MRAIWLAGIVLAYLPGALVYRIPDSGRDFRAGLAAEERAFWAVLLSVLWSTGVVLTLAAIGQYSFGRLVTANLVLSASTLLIWRGGLAYRGTAPKPGWSALVPAALVAFGLWSYFPPSEYVIGGKDPGTYLNEGVQIARRGQLVVSDPIVSNVPPPFRDLFFPRHRGLEDRYYGLRFMGFFIDSPDKGRVVGQFPHMFPASVAMGYGLNGLTGARQAIGVWAILGLLAVYFAGTRIFGRVAAAAATALLAMNVVTIWFARYPNSELTMQALVFAAMLAFMYALEGGRRFFGAAAAIALGSMLFLRYEIALAFLTFVGAALVAPVTRARVGAVFWVTFTIVVAMGFFYLAVPMRAYSAYPAAFLSDLGGWWLAVAGLAAILAGRLLLRIRRIADTVRLALPFAVAVPLVGLAIYAYFFRQEAGRTALGDAISFRAFGWYVGAPVLAMAVAAWAVLAIRRFWTSPVFFLTVGFFSLFFFYKLRIVPEHFWAARRFLGVTLPGALLLAAALVDTLIGPRAVGQVARRFNRSVKQLEPGTRNPAPSWSTALGITLVTIALVPVAVAYWNQSAAVRDHVEYAGVIPALEALSSQVGDNDLLIVEARNAGSDLHTLALPLAYVYGRPLLVLDSPAPIRRLFEHFVIWAGGTYDRVLFLGGGGTDLLARHVRATPLISGRISVPEYESALNAYPSGVRRKDFEFGLYELRQVSGDERPSLPVSLQIGRLDDLNVVRFHARETRGDADLPFRWTTAQSFVLIPAIPDDAATVTLWLGHGGRPRSAPAPVVEVAFANVEIGTAVPENAPAPFTFELPRELVREAAATGDPVSLRLRVATWNPRELLGAPDSRELGVMVTRVEVR